jgi:hypothetical protein
MVDSEVKRTDPADVDKGVKMEAAWQINCTQYSDSWHSDAAVSYVWLAIGGDTFHSEMYDESISHWSLDHLTRILKCINQSKSIVLWAAATPLLSMEWVNICH